MARLDVRLLGGIEVRLDGQTVDFPTRYCALLLAYLALAPDKDHGRDKLASLLWSDRSEDQARGALRQTLYRLRRLFQSLSPAPLGGNARSVRFSSDSLWCDVAAFEESALGERNDLEKAFDLYKGDFLANSVAASPAFETWAVDESLRLRKLAVDGFRRLASRQRDQNCFTEMEATARKLIELGRFDEAAHRLLMTAYALQNQRTAALSAYKDLRELLKSELDVSPEPTTVALYASIRDGEMLSPDRVEGFGATTDQNRPADTALSDGSGKDTAAAQVPHGADTNAPRPPAYRSPNHDLPDKPSIAVLPFRTLGGDADQENISDGITEDIITALSRSPWLFVIGRGSSFAYQNQDIGNRQIADDLGVRYLLTGSVRKSGDRLRVNAQLVDGTNGTQAWAEKYDATIADVFDLQDEITQKVVSSLHTQIRLSEGAKPPTGEHPDLRTWSNLRRGWKLLYELRPETLSEVRELMEQAIELDPQFSEGYYLLACAIFHEVHLASRPDPDGALMERAMTLARRSVVLEDTNEYAHWVLGLVYLYRGSFDQAVAEQERAIELNPNCSLAYGSLGTVLAFAGDVERSIQCNELAIKLNPYDPSLFFRYAGIAVAHFIAGRYEDAVAWSRKVVNRRSSFDLGHAVLAASLWRLGQRDDAATVVSEFRLAIPGIRLASLQRLPFRNEDDLDRLLDLLKNAGLPE